VKVWQKKQILGKILEGFGLKKLHFRRIFNGGFDKDCPWLTGSSERLPSLFKTVDHIIGVDFPVGPYSAFASLAFCAFRLENYLKYLWEFTITSVAAGGQKVKKYVSHGERAAIIFPDDEPSLNFPSNI
jgi:hypothetical protein